MPRRQISNLSFKASLRDDRTARKDIREERLSQPNMSAWRGESGKRYAVVRGELSLDGAANLVGPSQSIVLIAAHRVGGASASIVDLYAGVAGAADLAEWVEQARAWGASELHAYRFAETAEERAGIVADLTDDALRARITAAAALACGLDALLAEAA